MQLSISLSGVSPSRSLESFWLSGVSRVRSSRPAVAVKRFACGYLGHLGKVYVERDRVSLFCTACGFESSGVELHTTHVRYAWMAERQRLRWEAHQHRWTWLRSARSD